MNNSYIFFSTKYVSLFKYNKFGDMMKKYIFSIIIALVIGALCGNIFLKQYDSYEGIKFTSNNGDMLYFIRYDIYDSLEEMEEKTLSLVNYIYKVVDEKYYVYIGITGNNDNLIKLNNYYSSLGYKTITEEFLVTNKEFLEELLNFDTIIASTDDEVVLSSVSSLVLEKYEELVNGSKN